MKRILKHYFLLFLIFHVLGFVLKGEYLAGEQSDAGIPLRNYVFPGEPAIYSTSGKDNILYEKQASLSAAMKQLQKTYSAWQNRQLRSLEKVSEGTLYTTGLMEDGLFDLFYLSFDLQSIVIGYQKPEPEGIQLSRDPGCRDMAVICVDALWENEKMCSLDPLVNASIERKVSDALLAEVVRMKIDERRKLFVEGVSRLIFSYGTACDDFHSCADFNELDIM